MLPKVAWALEHKPRPPVLWFHFQECTCCSESFIRASHPLVADILLDNISLDYTQTLQAAAGEQAEAAVRNTMEKYPGQYLMLIEGSIPIEADGPDRRDTTTQNRIGKTDHQGAGVPADRRHHGRRHRPPARLRPHSEARRPRSPESALLEARARYVHSPRQPRRGSVRRELGR